MVLHSHSGLTEWPEFCHGALIIIVKMAMWEEYASRLVRTSLFYSPIFRCIFMRRAPRKPLALCFDRRYEFACSSLRQP
jgi:hypothetical protein